MYTLIISSQINWAWITILASSLVHNLFVQFVTIYYMSQHTRIYSLNKNSYTHIHVGTTCVLFVQGS